MPLLVEWQCSSSEKYFLIILQIRPHCYFLDTLKYGFTCQLTVMNLLHTILSERPAWSYGQDLQLQLTFEVVVQISKGGYIMLLNPFVHHSLCYKLWNSNTLVSNPLFFLTPNLPVLSRNQRPWCILFMSQHSISVSLASFIANGFAASFPSRKQRITDLFIEISENPSIQKLKQWLASVP